jgi:mannose-6-phosphate isomerase
MWYVIEADPGAELIFGLKKAITKDEFAARIAEHTLLEVTNNILVKKGDVFFIEAGTLHAIGAGLLIAEIQQNSNTTYRVYDYGRKNKDGKERPLHIENAIEVTNLSPAVMNDFSHSVSANDEKLLSRSKYFTVFELKIRSSKKLLVTSDSFCSLLFTEGEGQILYKNERYDYKTGDCYFLPAGLGECEITGSCTVLKTIIETIIE